MRTKSPKNRTGSQGWRGAPATRTLRIGGGVVIAGWAFVLIYGFAAWTGPGVPGPVIVGVQGNVPQHEKMRRGTENLYDKHVRLTVQGAVSPARWTGRSSSAASAAPALMRRRSAESGTADT